MEEYILEINFISDHKISCIDSVFKGYKIITTKRVIELFAPNNLNVRCGTLNGINTNIRDGRSLIKNVEICINQQDYDLKDAYSGNDMDHIFNSIRIFIRTQTNEIQLFTYNYQDGKNWVNVFVSDGYTQQFISI
jgi:hypothetical protein